MWPFGRRRNDGLDLDSFGAEIASASPPPGYGGIERFQDFRAVFLTGNSSEEQRRRVLAEIVLNWGKLWKGAPQRPEQVQRFEGRRDMALQLLDTIYVEPRSKPTTARRS